MRDLSHAT